jgi:hypothetical protein
VIAHQLQHVILTLNDSYLGNHVISQQILSTEEKQNNKPRKCGGCGQNGHDCRNCPVNPGSARPQQAQEEVVVGTAVEGGHRNPIFMQKVDQEVSNIEWEKVFYVTFDQETTGRNRQLNKIIEIAARFGPIRE